MLKVFIVTDADLVTWILLVELPELLSVYILSPATSPLLGIRNHFHLSPIFVFYMLTMFIIYFSKFRAVLKVDEGVLVQMIR